MVFYRNWKIRVKGHVEVIRGQPEYIHLVCPVILLSKFGVCMTLLARYVKGHMGVKGQSQYISHKSRVSGSSNRV